MWVVWTYIEQLLHTTFNIRPDTVQYKMPDIQHFPSVTMLLLDEIMPNKVLAVVEEELFPDLDAAVGVDSNPSQIEVSFDVVLYSRVETKKS